jgi:UDP:flavonoid glycosyltransferase YjiC (YdhE family)
VKVLVTSTPIVRHAWDMVPLAWALRSAGHEVRVATLPEAATGVRETGLTAMPVGPALDPRLMWPEDEEVQDPGSLALWARKVAQAAGLLAHGLLNMLDVFRPGLVIYEDIELAGPLVAQFLGVPAVHVNAGAPYPARRIAALSRAAAGLRRRLGMDEEVAPPSLVTSCFPPSFQAVSGRLESPYQSMRYVPYVGPGAVPDWLLEPAAGPRVCVAFSGSNDRGLAEVQVLSARIARVVCDLGLEVVTPSRPGFIPPLCAEERPEVRMPDEVRAVGWVPMSLLLATCALVVHHGGPATTLTALSLGVPQLTAVLNTHGSADQHAVTAGLVTARGAGLSVPRGRREDAISTAVQQLLNDPAYRQTAASIAAEIEAMPSPAEVAAVLEDLVAQWPTPLARTPGG